MIKIVIVDDHKIFLDGMEAVLSSQPDMEVLFTETNANEALKKIKMHTPDLIISDISMPHMNGLEFMKIIKEDFPNIKILVLSMFDNLQSNDDMDGYLLKETNTEELLLAIKRIVLKRERYFKTDNHPNAFEFKKVILTQREKEIIKLIAEEFTTDEIAEKLFLSKGTIETHRKNIFFKLQVKNIAGLMKKAAYLGIVK